MKQSSVAAQRRRSTDYEPLNQAVTVQNRATGKGYDQAGNMTSDGSALYTYDTENRLATAGGVTYTYDGHGKRVKKSSGVLYWMGTGSDALVETNSAGTVQSEYIFFNGKRIARIDGAGAVNYYFADHLGTSRTMTTATGDVCYDADYYPWGREQHVYTNSCPQAYKFTGKERDNETGLDYFGARYYGSNVGRFTSPDLPFADQHVGNAQSWNLYSYARNNPLIYVDPDGRGVLRTLIRVYRQLKHQRELVSVIRGSTGRRTTSEVKRALDSIDTSKGFRRVVETDKASTRNALGTRLSKDGRIRGPESSPGYPEHVNPRTGPYDVVHVQTKDAARKIGYLSAIGAAVAPYSTAEAENPNATGTSILSAAAWDAVTAIDPFFITDAIEWAAGLSPEANSQDPQSEPEKKGEGSDQNKHSICKCRLKWPEEKQE